MEPASDDGNKQSNTKDEQDNSVDCPSKPNSSIAYESLNEHISDEVCCEQKHNSSNHSSDKQSFVDGIILTDSFLESPDVIGNNNENLNNSKKSHNCMESEKDKSSNAESTVLSEQTCLNKNNETKNGENKLDCLAIESENKKCSEQYKLTLLELSKIGDHQHTNQTHRKDHGITNTFSQETTLLEYSKIDGDQHISQADSKGNEINTSVQENLSTFVLKCHSSEGGNQTLHQEDRDLHSAKIIEGKNAKVTADFAEVVKENQASDIVSLCSSQSCDSEYESDTLLSELETELEQGNEQMNEATNKNLNGVHPSLQSRCTESRVHKFKKYHTRSGERIASSDKQAIEYYELQIEFLERANVTLQRELAEAKEKNSSEESEVKKQLKQMKAELETRIEKIQKQNETMQKERDNMVLRYAQSERDVIHLKKVRDELEKKLREAAKDREGIINRVKSLNVEKARLSGILESKAAEIQALRRENDRLKEEMNSRDIRIKWTQNKLKTEMDAHKETQVKLEHTVLRLQETREEAEQIRKDCQEMIRRYQEAEEIKSVSLDHQLREKLGELEVQKQERSDQEEVYQLVKQELEALKKKHKLSIEENNLLTVKIHTLEKERLEHEQTVSKLKECQNTLRQEVVDLTGQLAEKQNLEMQLEREKERVIACQKEVERYRIANSELQSDMEACRSKEGELLEFTERLTAKSVQLQSEHSLLETKANTIEEEMNRINKKCAEWEQQNLELCNQLEQERNQRKEETQLLARKLAEKTKTVEQLLTKLEDAENENRVMKRRHITSIKELSRELQQARKRLDAFEINQSCGDTVSLGSRTSSTGSLDAIGNNHQNNHQTNTNHNSGSNIQPTVAFSGGKGSNKGSPSQTNPESKMSSTPPLQQKQNSSPPPNVSPLIEVDKQMLVERIVKLQKILARKNEKIEFQEEHINHLIAEMKKKTRVIQSYILREEAGALSSSSMDQNKADVAKRGGIMASLYSSHAADSGMTLELSLEINNKLQAVLEDTLLKNITLKENINTLGEEIARLIKQQRLLSSQTPKTKNCK